MEILVEIDKEEAEKLNITSAKLTLEELKRKVAMAKMKDALEKSHKAAKLNGMDKWTMDDINNIIAEARADYNDKNSD